MKKILVWFTKWEKDKVLHVLLSLAISMVAAVVAKSFGGDKFAVLTTAWFAGFAVGIAKELYDEQSYGGADSADWAADMVGTTLGAILAFLMVC